MQTTSATWKALWASGEAMLETRAIIADVAYTQMTSPTISRALTQDGLSIGNAVAASCQFAVLADSAAVPKAAPVRIEMRLRDGDTMSEWLPAGTFYISHRGYDPVSGVLTLECFDALLRANADAPNGSGIWVTDQGVEVVTNAGENLRFGFDYPQSAGDMVAKIATLLGVTPDPRNQIASGDTIDTPTNGTTLQDILKKIGTLNGGNWIITPANQLRLVPVVSAANADSASSNVVDLLGITQGISARSVRTITGVRYTDPEAGAAQVIGTEQGLVLSAGDVTAAQAQAIYTRLQGMTYQAYALSGAIYDPAAELGDYVRGGANGEIRSVLYSETAVFSELYHADISAPESGELADEYPYLGASAKALNEAKNFAEEAASEAEEAAKSYADDVASGLDQSLDQTAIFNRLTNNGALQGMFMENGNIYFNATYVKTGTLAVQRLSQGVQASLANGDAAYADASAAQHLVYKSATSALPVPSTPSGWVTEDRNIQNTWTTTRPQYSSSYPVLFVALQREGVDGTITCTTPVVDQTTTVIDGGRITTGTIDAGVANIININASNINTGTLDADTVTVKSQSSNSTSLVYHKYVTFHEGNMNFGVIGKAEAGTEDEDFDATSQIYEAYTLKYNDQTHKYDLLDEHSLNIFADRARFQLLTYKSRIALITSRTVAQQTRLDLDSSAGITAQMYSGPFAITGDFTVSGTKSRVVDADQYSDRLLYCYETASPMFGDVGEGVIGEDGRCYIFLDPVFAQAVESNRYQVFLQAYGYGRCYVLERHPSYFIVAGLSEMAFGWEVKARQKGYEAQRLESAAAPFRVPAEDYGDAAADYIENLQKGMIL